MHTIITAVALNALKKRFPIECRPYGRTAWSSTVMLLGAAALFAADTDIRLNTLGFVPGHHKRASIGAVCSSFSVVNASDESVVLSGRVTGPKTNADTREELYIADFSSLTAEGTYYLRVDGVGRSPDFPVRPDAYNFAYYSAMRAMFLWRCGTAVSGTFNGHRYAHAQCHADDAYLDYISGHVRKESLKGWHDAGDYNKYTVNAGITVGMMLQAWQQFKPLIERITLGIPESGQTLPDFLAEVKWELDWVLTMQLDDGSVSHKISTPDFCDFILPEDETAPRYFVPWGSAATADFVAMTAMAARAYEPYDANYAKTCLDAARKSHDFLAANPSNHHADQTGFTTGGYITTDTDDRLWAAAEMWETTGERQYLSDFETRANSQRRKIDFDWDWGNVKNLGMYTYLLSKRTGKSQSLYDAIKASLIQVADSIVGTGNDHGYGRPLGTTYYWGCNGTVARQTMSLQIANLLSPDADYTATALDAIGHLFGRNYYCRSFVTGLGHNPPMHPHDRRSFADSIVDPWPGYLVGGGWPGATNWVDLDTSYRTNEIAINWQGALIYALAGFIAPVNSGISMLHTNGNRNMPREVCFPVNGLTHLTLPAGIYTVYTCQGRMVKHLTVDRRVRFNAGAMGLGRGIFFMKRQPSVHR
ncbi:MAG: glycoside hydrolase family 9 protein [Chitinispirillaceae bacterium]|nr:glycoside hydrolase family 9 protein [Chitinispirillaceae bacterium]